MFGKEMDEATLFGEVFGDGDMFVDKNLIFVEVGDHYEVEGYNGSTKELIVPAWYKYKPVTVIREGAFSGLDEIEVLTLGSSLVTIGARAFSGCRGLRITNIPESTREIGEYAFGGCASLESVTIPSGVLVIGERAFGAREDFVAYCYDEAQPEGWHELWNSGVGSVKWGAGEMLSDILNLSFDL